jgi:transcriptional regulator with XRE-family HTH domain
LAGKKHFISDNIKSAMARKSLTTAQLADCSKIPTRTLNRLLTDANGVRWESLVSLAKGLGTTPQQLVAEEFPPPSLSGIASVDRAIYTLAQSRIDIGAHREAKPYLSQDYYASSTGFNTERLGKWSISYRQAYTHEGDGFDLIHVDADEELEYYRRSLRCETQWRPQRIDVVRVSMMRDTACMVMEDLEEVGTDAATTPGAHRLTRIMVVYCFKNPFAVYMSDSKVRPQIYRKWWDNA